MAKPSENGGGVQGSATLWLSHQSNGPINRISIRRLCSGITAVQLRRRGGYVRIREDTAEREKTRPPMERPTERPW